MKNLLYISPTTARGDANDPVKSLLKLYGFRVLFTQIFYGKDNSVVYLEVEDVDELKLESFKSSLYIKKAIDIDGGITKLNEHPLYKDTIYKYGFDYTLFNSGISKHLKGEVA